MSIMSHISACCHGALAGIYNLLYYCFIILHNEHGDQLTCDSIHMQ